MNNIKNFMVKNRFASYAIIFPFAFVLTMSVFSILLNFILPVLVSAFLTKYFFSFFVGHSKLNTWRSFTWGSTKKTTLF